jgi:hypothetical protein
MTEQHWTTDDFDKTWKEILDGFFDGFMKLFFPNIYDDIDWNHEYESLDKELHQIIPQTKTTTGFVDKLIKVHRKNGEEACVYIHLEIQSQFDKKIEERMYIYHIQLYLKYKQPIMSILVLGDDQPNWKPKNYEYTIWDCKLNLEFQTVKLLEYRDRVEELKKSRNPFAFFLIAHLKTLDTKKIQING